MARPVQPADAGVHEHPALWENETPEELALRAQRGSSQAYAVLVERFQERLYNFLLRRARTSADAEDLAQEAFIRAWQRISTYRSQWRFSTWLFTIAVRLAVSEARRPSRQAGRLCEIEGQERTVAGAGLIASEERARIWAVVGETLSIDQQTAVWLRYVEGMAITDISCVMGRSQVAVRVMLFRARGLLAAAMGSQGRVIGQSKARAATAGIKG